MNLLVKDKKGIVVLVGAGPGDEGLITVKGKTWLERADVVVYDHLANRNLNQYARSDAEIIYAGKKSGQATLTQDEINSLLVEKALEGKMVVRLKGGDPFIFGRGGEEVQFLKEADIPFAIVPGVTSPIGVSAYAGIPLTHRDFASSVSIITGSLGENKKTNDIEWDKVAAYAGTLVFLMGARKLDLIVAQLIKHGKSPDTPIAIIQSGTTPQQKTWTGTLSTIEQVVNKDVVCPPALTIIGEVVKLKETVDWFEQLPLFGKTVVLTRPKDQSESLIDLLQEQGATPIIFPVVQDYTSDDWGQLDQALLNLSDYDGVIFSSGKGVQYFSNRLREKRLDIRELKGLEVYTHGTKANQAVEALGIRVTPISNPLDAETLKKSMGKDKLSGCRYLLPRAANAPQHLPELLMELGAVVDAIPVYQSLPHCPKDTGFFESFGHGEINVITFTSAETVKNFYKLTPKNLLPRLEESNIVCIGPATANAAKSLGLKVRVVPEQCTIEAMVEAMVLHYS
jgi:uroporphyrinogen III methyltransferase / synthase